MNIEIYGLDKYVCRKCRTEADGRIIKMDRPGMVTSSTRLYYDNLGQEWQVIQIPPAGWGRVEDLDICYKCLTEYREMIGKWWGTK